MYFFTWLYVKPQLSFMFNLTIRKDKNYINSESVKTFKLIAQ